MIKDEDLSLRDGALLPINYNNNTSWYFRHIEAVAKAHDFSLDVPFKDLPDWAKEEIFYGCGKEKFPIVFYEADSKHTTTWMHHWEGLVNNFSRRYRETNSEQMREEFEKYMNIQPCDACHGARLRPESLAVTVGDINIHQLSLMTIREARDFLNSLKLSEREGIIARRIIKEIDERLGFLLQVGLDYLTLFRGASTLSGGESQRIRLATQIGSHLMGVL